MLREVLLPLEGSAAIWVAREARLLAFFLHLLLLGRLILLLRLLRNGVVDGVNESVHGLGGGMPWTARTRVHLKVQTTSRLKRAPRSERPTP